MIEHTEVSPSVYTLYAHLARVDPNVRVGVGRLDRDQQLAEPGWVQTIVLCGVVQGDRGARAVDGQENGVAHDVAK